MAWRNEMINRYDYRVTKSETWLDSGFEADQRFFRSAVHKLTEEDGTTKGHLDTLPVQTEPDA